MNLKEKLQYILEHSEPNPRISQISKYMQFDEDWIGYDEPFYVERHELVLYKDLALWIEEQVENYDETIDPEEYELDMTSILFYHHCINAMIEEIDKGKQGFFFDW